MGKELSTNWVANMAKAMAHAQEPGSIVEFLFKDFA